MEAFQYADDSDGEIGGLASDCIEVMENLVLAEKSDSSITLKLFNRLLEDSNDHAYEGWEEFTIDILRLCAEISGYGSVASTAQGESNGLSGQNLTLMVSAPIMQRPCCKSCTG
ncbi:MAG: hypothetical protein IPF67_20525 [Saprospiraceae bacterium]|nr:hypothetical protein [Candidatus Brachybacter algidus]